MIVEQGISCSKMCVKLYYKPVVLLTSNIQMIPLQLVPLYAPVSYPDRYWTAQRNTTEWSVFMTELVLSGNQLTKLMLEALAPKLPDSHIGSYTSFSLEIILVHSRIQAFSIPIASSLICTLTHSYIWMALLRLTWQVRSRPVFSSWTSPRVTPEIVRSRLDQTETASCGESIFRIVGADKNINYFYYSGLMNSIPASRQTELSPWILLKLLKVVKISGQLGWAELCLKM